MPKASKESAAQVDDIGPMGEDPRGSRSVEGLVHRLHVLPHDVHRLLEIGRRAEFDELRAGEDLGV